MDDIDADLTFTFTPLEGPAAFATNAGAVAEKVAAEIDEHGAMRVHATFACRKTGEQRRLDDIALLIGSGRDNPALTLRMPLRIEGVDRLIQAWRACRDDAEFTVDG